MIGDLRSVARVVEGGYGSCKYYLPLRRSLYREVRDVAAKLDISITDVFLVAFEGMPQPWTTVRLDVFLALCRRVGRASVVLGISFEDVLFQAFGRVPKSWDFTRLSNFLIDIGC